MALEPRSQIEAEGRRRKKIGVALLIAALAACGPRTPAEATKADLDTMKRETEVDKLVDRGRGFASVGDFTRAEEYLAAALEQGAEPKVVLPMLMQVCIASGKYRVAVQYGENHLRKHPDDVRTRFVVGTLYAALGDSRPARENLETVVEQRPNDSNAHYALAVLARDDAQNPDLVLADRHFREYLRLDPNGAHAEEAKNSLLKRMP
jgi:Tfp pilus assembly protein PilF